jgi:hypothetical protein
MAQLVTVTATPGATAAARVHMRRVVSRPLPLLGSMAVQERAPLPLLPLPLPLPRLGASKAPTPLTT